MNSIWKIAVGVFLGMVFFNLFEGFLQALYVMAQ